MAWTRSQQPGSRGTGMSLCHADVLGDSFRLGRHEFHSHPHPRPAARRGPGRVGMDSSASKLPFWPLWSLLQTELSKS